MIPTHRFAMVSRFLVLLLLLPQSLFAQQEKIAAFKQALAQNQKQLRQYQWIETTTISLKGEVKGQAVKQCSYGPDGKVKKQQLTSPPPQETAGGLKGKKIAQKKAELKDYMERAVFWAQQYVPPDSQKIQAAQAAGNLSLTPGAGGVGLGVRNYLKPGDSLQISVNTTTMAIQHIAVKTYMDSQEDKVTLDVGFATLNDGVDYPEKTLLLAPAKEIQVVIQNSNYQIIAPAPATAREAASAAPQQQQAQGPPPSPQQIDALTAPIALYPDALVNQILEASTDVLQLQSFAGWMTKNAAVHGSGLQDAASKAGFAPCYVALVPFAQVVQMMTQKLDWTTQLGQAFKASRSAVFDSIQRLRAQAIKAGSLTTNEQQTVTTETTSTGQTVYVVYPTNPQVVYVPTYNPTTVYVTSSQPSAAMAFTAGVIIAASASNNYYYGPYGWRGGAYNSAYNNSQYRQDNRQDTYSQNSDYRQDTHQSNQSTRQSTANTAQSTTPGTQGRDPGANQAGAAGNRGGAGAGGAGDPGVNQAGASGNRTGAGAQGGAGAQNGRSTAAGTSSAASGMNSGQRSGGSGGFSGGGYQSGSTTRSQSSRGSSSLSSSRSGSGGGSRSGGSRSGGSRSGGGGSRR